MGRERGNEKGRRIKGRKRKRREREVGAWEGTQRDGDGKGVTGREEIEMKRRGRWGIGEREFRST